MMQKYKLIHVIW